MKGELPPPPLPLEEALVAELDPELDPPFDVAPPPPPPAFPPPAPAELELEEVEAALLAGLLPLAPTASPGCAEIDVTTPEAGALS